MVSEWQSLNFEFLPEGKEMTWWPYLPSLWWQWSEDSAIPILTSTEEAAENLHLDHQGSHLWNSSRILPEKLFLKVEHILICMLQNHQSLLLLMRDLATRDNSAWACGESVRKESKGCGGAPTEGARICLHKRSRSEMMTHTKRNKGGKASSRCLMLLLLTQPPRFGIGRNFEQGCKCSGLRAGFPRFEFSTSPQIWLSN